MSPSHKTRCAWVNLNNKAYVAYHDTEWGVPVYDDHLLFEILLLETFQSGLSWECVLNKRTAFREAFDDFNATKIAHYDAKKHQALTDNAGIIRHKGKIQAATKNARVFLAIQEEWGSFAKYLWHWTKDTVCYETGKTTSPLSDTISKDLKKRGMSFVGSITIYSYLQAIGIINGHEPHCHCYAGK